MTDRQCLRCGDPLQSSSAISNYCMPCQMRLASSIDTERAARLAAEARVKVLTDTLRLIADSTTLTHPQGGVAENHPVIRAIARAALKEPTNG